MYRIRPSVAHRGLTALPRNANVRPYSIFQPTRITTASCRQLEANFSLLNPEVEYVPSQLAWDPFPVPSSSQSVDFVDGMNTILGQGDPALGEGLAIHIYGANFSMEQKAFCSNDGDMLILPQQGRLDIQTEFGRSVNLSCSSLFVCADLGSDVQPDDQARRARCDTEGYAFQGKPLLIFRVGTLIVR